MKDPMRSRGVVSEPKPIKDNAAIERETLRAALNQALERADWWRDRCIESDCCGLALEDALRDAVRAHEFVCDYLSGDLGSPENEIYVDGLIAPGRALLEKPHA